MLSLRIIASLVSKNRREDLRPIKNQIFGAHQTSMLLKYTSSFLISLSLLGCGATLERGVGDNIIVTATGDNVEIATRKANEKADSYCGQKKDKAIYIRGTTREQWEPRFVAEMVYQCGQDTAKLLAENREKCKSETNIPELDPIRNKVDFFDSKAEPTPAMLANKNYPTSEEKFALSKWIQLRDECIKRQKLILSKEVKLLLVYELRDIDNKSFTFSSQLVFALYEGKITFAEFARKRHEIYEKHYAAYREAELKIFGKSYSEADLEAMRKQLITQAQQISKDSVSYFEALAKMPPNKQIAKSTDAAISASDLVKENYKLDAGKLVQIEKKDNAVAIIIGIQSYKRLAKADFADQDATKFAEYANRALGIPKDKIKVLIDTEADQSALLKAFRNWLPLNVNKGKTEVFVFYSGHGLPSVDGKSLYFLPHAADQDLLDETAIDQKKIIAAIQSTQPKSVTMFIDSCYSGQSRNGSQLLAGAKPVALKSSDIGYPAEFTVFTASASDQISSASNDLQHGIFSFYLMKGMEGAADINKDGKITFGEMQQYLSENVQRQALAANRVQVPQLIGDVNRILVGR